MQYKIEKFGLITNPLTNQTIGRVEDSGLIHNNLTNETLGRIDEFGIIKDASFEKVIGKRYNNTLDFDDDINPLEKKYR